MVGYGLVWCGWVWLDLDIEIPRDVRCALAGWRRGDWDWGIRYEMQSCKWGKGDWLEHGRDAL